MPTPSQIEAVYRAVDKCGTGGVSIGHMVIPGYGTLPHFEIRAAVAVLIRQNRITDSGDEWFVSLDAIQREETFRAEARKRDYAPRRGIPLVGTAGYGVWK